MTIHEDTAKVLDVLVEASRDEKMRNEDLSRKTGLDARRLSDAVQILEDAGFARPFRPMGTAPYDFLNVAVTPAGRFAQEQATGESLPRDPDPAERGPRVFIVHGRNEDAREKVARFVERLGLQTIILHEQPNQGRTIIEKFVDHSDVDFAVVLLTADDRGGAVADSLRQQHPRARQNVLLELGFFLGKLGRSRVCALYEEGVEIPSDYQGILYLALDRSGTWRLGLARELAAAGLHVSAEAILSTTSEESSAEPEVEIYGLSDGQPVNQVQQLSGRIARIPASKTTWLVVQPRSWPFFHPQPGPLQPDNAGIWFSTVYFGTDQATGEEFDLLVLLADLQAAREFESYLEEGQRTGEWPGIAALPSGAQIMRYYTVRR